MTGISAAARGRRDQRHAIASGLLDGLVRDLARDFERLQSEGDPLDPADDFAEVERLILGAANGQPEGGVRVLSAICAAAVLRLSQAAEPLDTEVPVSANEAEGALAYARAGDFSPEDHSGYYQSQPTCGQRAAMHACYRDPEHADEAHICLCGLTWSGGPL